MSYEVGWAAMNLQMPPRVPRVEASVNWYLVKAVTGIDVSADSDQDTRWRAIKEFIRLWNWDMVFNCAVGYNVLEKKRSSMGHAEYAEDGRDFDNNIYCPFKSVEEVLAFDPWETYGPHDEGEIIKRFDDSYRAMRREIPDAVTMTGIYTTLMSGMIAIFGWDMLLTAAGTDPDGFGAVLNRYATWIGQFYTALAKSQAPVIYSHDDMVWTEGAFIRPDWYRKYVFPNLKKLWAPLVDAGKKIIFFCDGNYTEFLDDVAACGNAGFWFECFTDLETVVEKFGETHVIVGNADTRILTFGTKEQIRAEVERCMAAGKKCPGYFMCMSGHMPANVPVENAVYYNEVYQELSRR
ncbi:MAG: uroporphyrinogen decarboxylase family protein [Planctomycetota bacterium]|jgi:hypothetical protein